VHPAPPPLSRCPPNGTNALAPTPVPLGSPHRLNSWSRGTGSATSQTDPSPSLAAPQYPAHRAHCSIRISLPVTISPKAQLCMRVDGHRMASLARLNSSRPATDRIAAETANALRTPGQILNTAFLLESLAPRARHEQGFGTILSCAVERTSTGRILKEKSPPQVRPQTTIALPPARRCSESHLFRARRRRNPAPLPTSIEPLLPLAGCRFLLRGVRAGVGSGAGFRRLRSTKRCGTPSTFEPGG